MEMDNLEIIEDIADVEEVKRRPIGVYVKRDKNGKVIQINSEIFIEDLTGWEKIDEGFGDKYAHAQSLYKIKTDSD